MNSDFGQTKDEGRKWRTSKKKKKKGVTKKIISKVGNT